MNYLKSVSLVSSDMLSLVRADFEGVFTQQQQHVPQSCATGYNMTAYCALLKGQVTHVALN